MLEYISKVVVALGGWSAFLAASGFLIKKGIEQYIQKDIERYRTELASEKEKILTTFQLYASKKHERYPEIFEKIEIAYGTILNLSRFKRQLTYENANLKDIQGYMDSMNFTQKDIEEISGLWEKEKEEAKEKLNYRVERIKYNSAQEKWLEANDTLIFNELFLDEEVSRECRGLLSSLWNYLELVDPDYLALASNQELDNQSNLRKEVLPKKRELVKQLMREELAKDFKI